MNQRSFQLIIFGFFFFAFVTCGEKQTKKPVKHPEGQKLAEQYCQSCHLLPDPADLDMTRWKYDVLPNMGERMGFNTGRLSEIETLKKLNLFPEETTLDLESWRKIQSYYIDNAPMFDTPMEEREKIEPNLDQFEVKEIGDWEEFPFVTLLQWDSEEQLLYYGTSVPQMLRSYSFSDQKSREIEVPGAPSYFEKDGNDLFCLTMGKVMPHHEKLGKLVHIERDQGAFIGNADSILDSLPRPVHISMDDFDKNGAKDIVISNFGNFVGELIVVYNFQTDTARKEVLKALPGALKTEIVDFNKDGLPDIIGLMAQGDESLILWTNKGGGTFSEERLMRFPATYGSTYFELLDFDEDGHLDILYVNGDNGDYLPIRKNYHGIRIFRNNGTNEFKEWLFLPFYGAFKAKVHDFDEDGDKDIAAISYFPDYKTEPQGGFVFFENQGNNNFESKTISEAIQGKWLTMESGDFDGDGDMDLVLGSAMFMRREVPRDIYEQWRNGSPGILFLENKLFWN